MSVIVFGAEKGGVGKTTLALSFAQKAAYMGVDVVLLDTDRQKTASNWAELRAQETALSPLSVLAHSANPLHEIASLAKRYDLVVVDIGAQNYKVLLECALLSDMYIVPTSTSGLDLDSVEDFYRLLMKVTASAPGKRDLVKVVLNKVPPHPSSVETQRTIDRLKASDIGVLKSIIPLRSAWRSMANTGRAVSELTGKNLDPRAGAEINALYDEVVSLLSGRPEK